jgi:dihydropteroate synthase
MLEEGADLIDVGGESTRPGAARTPADEELRRVIPVIEALAAQGVPVSVDTMRASVAAAAVEAGAVIINDVSGAQADPAMAGVMAKTGVVAVLTHWRAPPDRMDQADRYADVVAEVAQELEESASAAVKAGVKPAAIVLDPGFGFSKSGYNNWPLLAGLDQLAAIGFPLLVGASRKRFLQNALADAPGLTEAGQSGRDAATAAVTTASSLMGAWCVRVHAVAANVAAVRVAQAIRDARLAPGDGPFAPLRSNTSNQGVMRGMIA